MPQVTPGDWFLGEREEDPQEWGWDGRVWAPPAPEDLEAAARGNYDPEPVEVARLANLADARLLLAAKAMLDALTGGEAEECCWPLGEAEMVLGAVARGSEAEMRAVEPEVWAEFARNAVEMCRLLRAALETITTN